MSLPNYNPKIGWAVDFNPANPSQIGVEVSKIALMEDYYTLGGFRVCDSVSGGTIAEVPPMIYDNTTGKPNYRNYITANRRKLGMVVYTMDDGKFWQLINNPVDGGYFPPQDEDSTFTNNSDWKEIIIPGSLSSVTFKDNILSINYLKSYNSGAYYTYDEWSDINGFNTGNTINESISESVIINLTLSGLTDVRITNPIDGQFLVYSGETWINKTGGSGGGKLWVGNCLCYLDTGAELIIRVKSDLNNPNDIIQNIHLSIFKI